MLIEKSLFDIVESGKLMRWCQQEMYARHRHKERLGQKCLRLEELLLVKSVREEKQGWDFVSNGERNIKMVVT